MAPPEGGAAPPMPAIGDFWRGGLPLGRAFWLWGMLGGAVVNLCATLLAAGLLIAELPAWLAAVAFVAPIPWNAVLLVGVWRSAQRPEVDRNLGSVAQLTIVVWAVVLSVV